jgi:hypothetical protein
MDTDSSGEYISLVVRLMSAAHGQCQLQIDGAQGRQIIPLVPCTLVIRLWRSTDQHLLRGALQLEGNDWWAPFQSNAQLEALVSAWLRGGAAPASD